MALDVDVAVVQTPLAPTVPSEPSLSKQPSPVCPCPCRYLFASPVVGELLVHINHCNLIPYLPYLLLSNIHIINFSPVNNINTMPLPRASLKSFLKLARTALDNGPQANTPLSFVIGNESAGRALPNIFNSPLTHS